MKYLIVCLLVFLFSGIPGFCQNQDNLVDIFTDNFEKGDLKVKYKVLKDAVDMNIKGMGPLFHTAIRFTAANLDLLDKEADMARIAKLSVVQIQKLKYDKAASDLLAVFIGSRDTELNVNILITLGDIASGDPLVVEKMNLWLDSQNALFLSGKTPDLQVIAACIQSLGKMGYASSFLPIFTAKITKYSILVTSTAEQALDMIKGDLATLYKDVIREGRYADKKEALLMCIKSEKLSKPEKCNIALYGLEVGLSSTPVDMDQWNINLDMRRIAAEFLGRMEWSKAVSLLIAHFNQALVDMDKGRVDKTYLISAVTALGSMSSHDAAKRLTLYLEVMNSYTEKYKVYDEQIVLAVIDALHLLGDSVANAALLYTRYLDYTKTVREAAEDALRSMR
jgi:hypothetical protein